MKVTDTLEFPDIQEILEIAEDVEDVWYLLIESLKENPKDLRRKACANKLIEFNKMRKSDIILELDEEQRELKNLLRKISKKYGYKIAISRRQKDLIGLIIKMIRKIRDGEEMGQTVASSLEEIRDFLGIRVVIMSGLVDTPESIKICYEVMNEILTYLVVEKDNTLATLSVDQTERSFEGIYIPEKSMIMPEYSTNVKDYVRWIKDTKYQSLHAAPTNSDKRTIEIQVRTEAMDIRAEFDKLTNHENHDKIRYEGIEIPVVLSRVHIKGFYYNADGKIYDKIGLVESIDPLNLL